MGFPDWQEEATLAQLISSALASAGIPVLGNPVPLYAPGQSVAGAGLVGCTTFGTNYPGSGGTLAAANIYDGYLNRNMGIACQKYYYTTGQFPTVIPQDVQDLMNAGCIVYICYKPAADGSDAAALYASVAAHVAFAAGAHIPTVPKFLLWQEPQNPKNNLSAAHFIALMATYQMGVRAHGPLGYDAGSHGGESAQAAYAPAAADIDFVLADYYCVSWTQGVTLATIQAIAQAAGVPLGLGEIGLALSAGTIPTPAQWAGYANYILQVFNAWLTAGRRIEMITYYNGDGNNWNTINSANDYRVASLQAMFDQLSSQSSAGSTVNIAAGATATIVPLQPSPGGGYALANGMSYDINARLTAGAGSTIPFMRARTNWYDLDQPTAPLAEVRSWSLPMGAAGGGGSATWGRGPQQGRYLAVTMKNLDTVQATAKVTLNSTGRQCLRDDWRWDVNGQASPPAFTLPGGTAVQMAGGTAYGLSLGSVAAVNVPAGQNTAVLFSMFAGMAGIKASTNSGVALTWTLFPQPSSLWGTGAIFNETATGINELVPLPRGACVLNVFNPSGGAVTFSAEMVAVEPS